MINFYDRTSFWLFIIDMPHLRGKELYSAVKIKLGSLFPGNIEDCNIHIRKNGVKKGSYLVFVLDKKTGKEMLPVTTLFIQRLYFQKNASIFFVNARYIEFIRIENGNLISSIVKTRSEDTLSDDIKMLCPQEENISVYCDKHDINLFDELKEKIDIQFFDTNIELKKVDVHKISLFSEKSPIVKRRRILLAATVLFLFLLGSWLLYQYNEDEKTRSASLKLEQEQRRLEELERRKEIERLNELLNIYQEIVRNKILSPFDIALIISQCANSQTRIQSATFNRNFFQIEGLTNSSLGLLKNFEEHAMVNNARLHQVNPFGNRDTFTLSGNVSPSSELVDRTLPISGQIAYLENLVAQETNNLNTGAQLSPSSFGLAVNSLLAKWGCTVISYQFLNEPLKTEIELSLRGTGNGFFNALYEIKTNYRLWEINLTQIRNLYPRNLIDVVVRIKTEYVNDRSENNVIGSSSDITQNTASLISRNYFPPQSAPPSSQTAKAVEQPVPAVVHNVSAERVSWLEYVGSIHEEDTGRFIFVKDTRTGSILRLGIEGNLRYAITPTGGIIAYINENIYEIARR